MREVERNRKERVVEREGGREREGREGGKGRGRICSSTTPPFWRGLQIY